MPKINESIEEEVRKEIRFQIALEPMISIMRLRKALLEKFNHEYDPTYILKLRRKVMNQIAFENKSPDAHAAVIQYRERTAANMRRLLKIINWKPEYLIDEWIDKPSNADIMMAMDALQRMDINVIKSIQAESVKQAEKTEEERRQLMLPDPEDFELFFKSFKAWKIPISKTHGKGNDDAPTESIK